MTDGWNTSKLNDILDACENIYSLQYEINNCIRGCYTGATTYVELADYIADLADELKCYASDLANDADTYDAEDAAEDNEFNNEED